MYVLCLPRKSLATQYLTILSKSVLHCPFSVLSEHGVTHKALPFAQFLVPVGIIFPIVLFISLPSPCEHHPTEEETRGFFFLFDV